MTKQANILVALLALYGSVLFLTGCQDEDILQNNDTYEELLNMSQEKKLIDQIGIPVVDSAYQNLTKADNVPVSVGFSAVPYYLPKDHPHFWDLYKIIASEDINYYEITYIDTYIGEDSGLPIIDIRPIPDSQQSELQDQYQKSLENSDNAARLPSVKTISLSQANSFFNDMEALSCASTLSNPCIPFQYATDGCYARAHYMRLRFQSTFGGDCQKLFVWRSTNTKLKANTTIGCCQRWDYHVAPLVSVDTNSGTKNYVIDPGLFSSPVLASTWINKVRGCSSSTIPMPNYSIKSGNTYAYIFSNGVFTTNSSGMYNTLDAYSTLYGCHNGGSVRI